MKCRILLLILAAVTVQCVIYDECIKENTTYVSINSNCVITQPDVILIGYLGTFKLEDHGVGTLIAGAIPEAIDAVNSNSSILPNHTLRFVPGDAGKFDTFDAMQVMNKMKDMGVSAFVGLEQSCEREAMLAAALNMTLISYKCGDTKVSNKTLYPTFARTLPPSSKVSTSLIATLKKFNWKKIVVVADNISADYRQIEDAFRSDLEKVNLNSAEDEEIKVTSWFHIPSDYVTGDKDKLADIIHKSMNSTRIYVVLADYYALVGFSRTLYNEAGGNFGDYVILSAEKDEVYDPERVERYCSREYDTEIVAITTNQTYNDTTIPRNPCSSLLVLAPSIRHDENYENFLESVRNRSHAEPFNVPRPPFTWFKHQIPMYAALSYDAVQVLAMALHKVLYEMKGSERDGSLVIEQIKNMEYKSILGSLQRMDKNGDAEGNYTLLSLQGSDGKEKMMPVAHFIKNCSSITAFCLPEFEYLSNLTTIKWTRGSVPKDEPTCGFDGEKCKLDPNWKMVTLIVVCCCIMIVVFVFVFKHYRYEQKLAALLWKIDARDVIIPRTCSEDTLQQLRSTVNFSTIDWSRFASFNNPSAHKAPGAAGSPFEVESFIQPHEGIGFYKGNVVFVKKVLKKTVDLTRNLRKELIQVKELRHENINPFFGASVDSPNICILTLYCARGSLEDILANQDITLDKMFIASLVADLIKGMIYLHDSEIVSHGNLKSSNCLVDSRWVLQISDFGLHEFKAGQDATSEGEDRHLRGLLWRAPELLRMMSPPARGTQKGDVYSFAIILYEIIGRKGPWGADCLPTKTILDKVTNAQYELRPYRPPLDKVSCEQYVIKTMEESWAESPEARPDFRFINILLRDLQKGLKPNIFDNMITIMERHAFNLEDLVKERTRELLTEKKKTEMLLLRMLPKTVADQLTRGEPVEPVSYKSVTIYFSDIVGFTELSAISTPLEVVDLLNDLYTLFDSIIENHDVYKVETIGDAYMVVSGLPQQNGDKHAGEVASMALHLLSAMQNFEIRHRPNERLKLRIGIHSGQCVAGVVGHKMPRYCLFGDTVCTASRMESSGEALKIHVSEACKIILDNLGGYILQERGLVSIKGKGMMKTHWLIGKQSRSSHYNGNRTKNGMNNLSNGFSNRDTCDRSPSIFGPTNKSLVTRTSSLGSELTNSDSSSSSINNAFLNRAYDNEEHSCASETDEDDVTEKTAFYKSKNGHNSRNTSNEVHVDMNSRIVMRGSLKTPGKHSNKPQQNFKNGHHSISAFC